MSYRILVVDDEEQVRRLVSKTCKELGWSVDEAADGNEGLERIRQRPHDVFLFDMKMPGLSGAELAGRVAEYEEAPAVLVLTGHPEVDTAVDAMKKGVLEYLSKPIDPEQLKRHLIAAAKYHDGRLRSLAAQREREISFQNIEEANERFRAMLELSHDAIFLLDARDGRITDCNATALSRLGYTRADILQMQLLDIQNLRSVDEWRLLMRDLREKGTLVVEGIERALSQKEIPVELSLSIAYSAQGEQVTAVVRDIVERKQAEAALHESKRKLAEEAEKLRSIIESIDEGIVLMDDTETITEANGWLLDAVRRPLEMVVGGSVWDFCSDQVKQELSSVVSAYRNGTISERFTMEQAFMGFQASIRVQPVFVDGAYSGMIWSIIDIRDWIEGRRRAERVARSKGDFLLETAREMQTELAGIMGMAEHLIASNVGAEQQALAASIVDCAQSLSSLVQTIQERGEM